MQIYIVLSHGRSTDKEKRNSKVKKHVIWAVIVWASVGAAWIILLNHHTLTNYQFFGIVINSSFIVFMAFSCLPISWSPPEKKKHSESKKPAFSELCSNVSMWDYLCVCVNMLKSWMSSRGERFTKLSCVKNSTMPLAKTIQTSPQYYSNNFFLFILINQIGKYNKSVQ